MTIRRCLIAIIALLFVSACAHERPATRPAAGAEAETLSVLTLNLWHDQRDWPARLAHIVDTLRARQPDVIALQEVLQKPGLPNQAATLADSLGYHAYFASVDDPEAPKRYGNALLTRRPVSAEGWKALAPADDYRTIAYVRLDVAGRAVDVYVTHLHHTPEGSAIRRAQVADALAFVDATRGVGPVLLVGDFNAVPTAPELAGLRARFADAYAAVHPAAADGGPTTLNPHLGHTPRRIDHLFFAQHAGLQPLRAEVLFTAPMPDGAWASDHFGVLGLFSFTPEQP